MSTLRIMRGLPGSGKTTAALKWVAEDPTGRVRISRDQMRAALHGGFLGEQWAEQQVTIAQAALIEAFLVRRFDVVVDDTNLREEHVKPLRGLAGLCNAKAEVWDMRDVDVDLCLARNAARPDGERVPERWIIDAWTEHIQPLEEKALATQPEASRG